MEEERRNTADTGQFDPEEKEVPVMPSIPYGHAASGNSETTTTPASEADFSHSAKEDGVLDRIQLD